MNQTTIFEVPNQDGSFTQHILIDRGNGEFTSMPKVVWDELEAKHESGEII